MDERPLIEACKRRNNTARAELYTTFAPRLMAICRRYAADTESAEDLLHDAFLKIFDHIGRFSYRGEGSLSAWMERLTVNEALSKMRADKSELFISADGDHSLTADIPDETFDGISLDTLTELIASLPAGCRTVFNLFCIEGWSHKEIAQTLKITERTSSSHLHRARMLLAQKVKDYEER